MKEEQEGKHICILKTGKLFEHDMAANALSENGIPYYKQMETSSGLRLAMPFQPPMGPGTWYNIFVHPKFAEEAKNLLNELPIDLSTDPGIWHFGPNKSIKKVWKILIWISLSVGFLLLIVGLIKNII